MIEIAIVALWTTMWFRPKWAVLNKGGILLLLLMAPAVAVVWWMKPEWLKNLMYWWSAYLAAFLAVGGLIVALRTRADAALVFNIGQPTTDWFPIVARASVPLAKRLPVLLAIGLIVGVVGMVFGHTPLQGAVLVGLAIGLLPTLPFGYLLVVVKLADFLSRSQPRPSS